VANRQRGPHCKADLRLPAGKLRTAQPSALREHGVDLRSISPGGATEVCHRHDIVSPPRPQPGGSARYGAAAAFCAMLASIERAVSPQNRSKRRATRPSRRPRCRVSGQSKRIPRSPSVRIGCCAAGRTLYRAARRPKHEVGFRRQAGCRAPFSQRPRAYTPNRRIGHLPIGIEHQCR
jgi:hypothetical protein